MRLNLRFLLALIWTVPALTASRFDVRERGAKGIRWKPEKGYNGPKFDRVKAFVNADGIVQGMNLAMGPNVVKLTDSNLDGVF